ncbi:MAG TPA: archaeosortase/exosortase family protein [bacterium]|nr:archaeosortase/exosortase family protein [bacterium]
MNALPYFLLIGAFWPSLFWYSNRVSNIYEAIPGLLTITSAIVMSIILPRVEKKNRTSWAFPIFLVIVYCLSYMILPPMLKAFIALTAICSVICLQKYGNILDLRIWGLFILSLPVIPSLQFYLGYPYRYSVAYITTPMIRFSGYSVSQEGTCLMWNKELVCIDAPCSGINMLWAGLFLTFSLSCIFNLDLKNTIKSILVSIFIIYLGNMLRSICLFYIESHIIRAPEWSHQAVGITSFIFVAASIFFFDYRIGRVKR